MLVAHSDETPPLQHEPTLYFTVEIKRHDCYSMVTTTSLAQMALRYDEDRYV